MLPLYTHIWSSFFMLLTAALRYRPEYTEYNINENETASNPLEYWGEWPNHTFHPSPVNWRMPMYTLFIDRFVNGDPTNDNANGTQFETDILSNQLRYGGDLQGLQDTLDYVQGMGVKTIYIAGSPFINMPWGSDGFSPLDLTLLDAHFGTIQTWRDLIQDMHQRGMYVILENTFATLGDLMGFEGYLNDSTPFAAEEHNVIWKSERRYHDFVQSDAEASSCTYPRFWGDDGRPVTNTSHLLVNCRDSEFDQYGEVASFGNYPEWQRQLSKFAFVQDRLREWRPSVLAKIRHFSCMVIASLDIDGYRIDKAVQVTVDSQGAWSSHIRQCAQKYGKNNFYIPGEIVTGNAFGSIYIGRGMEPEMQETNLTKVVTTTNNTNRTYVRDLGHSALDAAAFHYTVYRAITRFLGLDGQFEAEGDPPVNFIETWNSLLETNDMSNAYTGAFDPRHMYGVGNQDVFRWPTIKNGTEKNLLGLFVVTLLFPGVPTLTWGEEQAFYVLESTNANYVFGRQPISSSRAWQLHGCYRVGSVKYANFPIDAGLYGCKDDNVSLDHRDPSHPMRNIIKRMFEMREQFPVLNDGYALQQLSNHTYNMYLPASGGTPTETGMWSVYRSAFDGVQDFTNNGTGLQGVWLVYTNEAQSIDYTFDCTGPSSLIAPYPAGTTVKNLFWPYEEYTLTSSNVKLGFGGSTVANGCLPTLNLAAWDYMALVPKDSFISPRPTITRFEPGHDFRVLSTIQTGETVHVKFGFSDQMICDEITSKLKINSTVISGKFAFINDATIECSNTSIESARWIGQPTTVFEWEADLVDTQHGIHIITLNNVSSLGGIHTNTLDTFLLRVGDFNNPMVFPGSANYSSTILIRDSSQNLVLNHSAGGADLWRASQDFGTTYTAWTPYHGGNDTLPSKVWSGTKDQAWQGEHVIVQYWSAMAGSSDHYQHGDLNVETPRRFPHMYLEGEFNQYGFDSGISNQMEVDPVDGFWKINFMTEWPSSISLNVWGMNPDGVLDVTQVFGDVDGDGIIDRIPPLSLLQNEINITDVPPSPYLTYVLQLHDGSFKYKLVPAGSRWIQLAVFCLLAIIPILTAIAATYVFMRSFYKIKFNKFGAIPASSLYASFCRAKQRSLDDETQPNIDLDDEGKRKTISVFLRLTKFKLPFSMSSSGTKTPQNSRSIPGLAPGDMFGAEFQESSGDATPNDRRLVLIATMEYDIEDWNIKVKIGGLGVMAQLMGKHLQRQNLIWVVPCVGDIEYPENRDEMAAPMEVTILDEKYQINIRIHILRNITYVLLDAPLFRRQTKAEPYPARMDDLESAVYYSAWNSCIAEAIRRFEPDLYHINDYHGAVAPLHLLPDTIPCALSLHNAEFQGMWPMRSKEERDEVCQVFNLPPYVVQEYVQFGEVFNLLHAGASYLRVHQNGFGAVGVSKKYGKRSYARYPIFWGLKGVGALPNPDPSDTADWKSKKTQFSTHIQIDRKFEQDRAGLRLEAQRWAGLNEDASAELFVFVGRWSNQKGIDLIADVFPAILEQHKCTQLICIGPVIDLYGRFAAVKLDRLMKIYPERVYSKPEFTQLPPCIFTGAEFALIPSRDEPFGLVAVEFGRKGALGVGARVGGLGQMPGWWYTVESTSTKHLLQQFKGAIESALATSTKVRAELRARSAKQRFPVVQWVQTLETLQATSIEKHQKYCHYGKPHPSANWRYSDGKPRSQSRGRSGFNTPRNQHLLTTATSTNPGSGIQSRRSGVPQVSPMDALALQQSLLSLGSVAGPGHVELVRDDESDYEQDIKDIPSHQSWFGSFERNNAIFTTLPRTSTDSRSLCTCVPEPTESAPPAEEDSELYWPAPSRYLADRSETSSFKDFDFDFDFQLEPIKFRPYRHKKDAAITSMPPVHLSEERGRSPATLPASPQWLTTTPSDQRHSYMAPSVISYNEQRDTMSSTGSMSLPTTFDGGVTTPGTIGPTTPSHLEPPQLVMTTLDSTQLSLDAVVGYNKDLHLQKTDPFFTDPKMDYQRVFERKLEDLTTKNSYDTCIKDFIEQSEKDWYNRLRGLKMGKEHLKSRFGIDNHMRNTSLPNRNVTGRYEDYAVEPEKYDQREEFLLGDNYSPPTGLKRLLLRRIGDWPFYSLLLAFGQIIAANSYQITLLTGEVGEAATKLYVIATIYLVTSIMWWVVYRTMKACWVLSTPFLFYGMAFFLVGMAAVTPSANGKAWVQNVATACYAVASSSGSLFFALNFGDQGGAPIESWVYRACVIQGTQQMYIAGLWWWGSNLVKIRASGNVASTSFVVNRPVSALSGSIIIALILWMVGFVLFKGLPTYYRQSPGATPSFLRSIFRRKIVLWFFMMVIIQNFFLSAPYGRNWLYLWSSQHVPGWSIAILAITFLVIVWALLLYIFNVLSKAHPWILPIFAIGLGAPRWCQMLWGVSGIGLYVPWAGATGVGSALAGRSLWLWLGVLDAFQGVGFGMILLHTLTRFHIAFTLVVAQVLGSIATICARGFAPDNLGPGPVFPNLGLGLDGIRNAWFWAALVSQLVINILAFKFFRKEQLSKP